jgi:hypothetical protein
VPGDSGCEGLPLAGLDQEGLVGDPFLPSLKMGRQRNWPAVRLGGGG